MPSLSSLVRLACLAIAVLAFDTERGYAQRFRPRIRPLVKRDHDQRYESVPIHRSPLILFGGLALTTMGTCGVIFGLLGRRANRCGWDRLLAKRFEPRVGPSPPSLDYQTMPGWVFPSRLMRLYVFPEHVCAIDYGPAQGRRVAPGNGLSRRLTRTQRRMHVLDSLGDEDLLRLAEYDRNSWVLPRHTIETIETRDGSFRKALTACHGHLLVTHHEGRKVGTFVDRHALADARATIEAYGLRGAGEIVSLAAVGSA